MSLEPDIGGLSVQESITAKGPLATTLAAGVGVISEQQTVRFTLYRLVILPLDGWKFWIRADLLSQSALVNGSPIGTFAPNQARIIVTPAPTFDAMGSLHFETTNQQGRDESFSINRVVFTALEPIQDLNAISDGTMYIAEIEDFKFAFSRRDSFYRQAGVWHYSGDALYPTMEPMVIDSQEGLDGLNVIVSNSLPIWLTMNKYMPMFPSFLVPDNIQPPYCAVDIESTVPIGMAPYLNPPDQSHYQLCRDRVRFLIYGLRNFNALSFLDYVIAASMDYQAPFGIMGESPVPRDEKRTQVEVGTLAMKKSIVMDVSYYQYTARNIAEQLILSCIPNFIIAV